MNKLLKLSQSVESKWKLHMEPSYSDATRKAPASDHNNAAPSPNFTRIVSQMKTETAQCLAATNKLLTMPQYQRSPGLNGFRQQLPQLAAVLNTVEGPDSSALAQVENALQGLKFFSDPTNRGTGYDPLTHAKMADGTSPGHFVDNLVDLNNQLKTTMEF